MLHDNMIIVDKKIKILTTNVYIFRFCVISKKFQKLKFTKFSFFFSFFFRFQETDNLFEISPGFNNGTLFYRIDNKWDCVYDISNPDFTNVTFRGFSIFNTQQWTRFDVYPDCCSKEVSRQDMNTFTVIDDVLPVTKSLYFLYRDTAFSRPYQSIFIYEFFNTVAWNIDTKHIIPGSTISMISSSTPEASLRHTVNVYNYRFNLTSAYTNSSILSYAKYNLSFKNTPIPFVNISGRTEIYLSDEDSVDKCQYRYTTDLTARSAPPTNGNLKMHNLCTTGNFKRMALCASTVEDDYKDCTCTYDPQEYIYLNEYADCTYMSELLTLTITVNQDVVPFEHLWNTFSTTPDMAVHSLIIPKGRNITFLGKVILPDSPILITGSVIFKSILVITRDDLYYDIGTFSVEEINIDNLKNRNTSICFVGRCGMEQTACERVFNSAGIKEKRCGSGSKNRYLPLDSEVNCDCRQSDSAHYYQSDCTLMSTDRLYRFDLFVAFDYIGGDAPRYWSSLTVLAPIKISGVSTIVDGLCNFEKSGRVELYGALRCKKVVLSSSSEIVGYEGSQLKSYDFAFIDKITNKNSKAVIHMGSGSFQSDGSMTVKVDPSQNECFEFASAKGLNSHSMDGTLISDKKYSLVVLGNLVRICPITKINKEVICDFKTSEYNGFVFDQCPCDNEGCVFRVDANVKELDFSQFTDLVFEGQFIIQNSLVIRNTDRVTFKSIKIENLTKELVSVDVIGGIITEIESPMIVSSTNSSEFYGNTIQFTYRPKGAFPVLLSGELFVINIDTIYTNAIELTNFKGLITTPQGMDIKKNGRGETSSTLSLQANERGKYESVVVNNNEYEILTCTHNDQSRSCHEKVEIEHCVFYLDDRYCVSCMEYYRLNTRLNVCEKISIANCKREEQSVCVQCAEKYELKNGLCQPVNIENCDFYKNNWCRKAQGGYYPVTSSTKKCSPHTLVCNSVSSLICSTGYILHNKLCVLPSTQNAVVSSNYNTIVCSKGYYIFKGVCVSCFSKYGNCELCTLFSCTLCKIGSVLNNGVCIQSIGCQAIQSSNCQQCLSGYYNKESCRPCGENCEICSFTGECQVCSPQYYKSGFNCYTNMSQFNTTHCTTEKNGECYTCDDHFYATHFGCFECSSNCSTCTLQSDLCTSCPSSYILQDHICLPEAFYSDSCLRLNAKYCSLCPTNYFHSSENYCKQCPLNSISCANTTHVFECSSGYFLFQNQCKKISEISNCQKTNDFGCALCYDGFALINSLCVSCSDLCQQCHFSDEHEICDLCELNYVIDNFECYPLSSIQKCSEADGEKCTKCETGYTLSAGRCRKLSRWYIYVIVAAVVVILFIIVILTILIVKKVIYQKVRVRQEHVRKITDVSSRTDLVFCCVGIVTDKPTIEFDGLLQVNNERSSALYLGNVGVDKVKVQPTIIGNGKYDIFITPELAILRKNEVCQFTVHLTPKCSTHIDDKIVFSLHNFAKNTSTSFSIYIDGYTEKTSIIDFDELTIDTKIGEGGFGIVYRGYFREAEVAIKTIKEGVDEMEYRDVNSPDTPMNSEFTKEVEMLEKFKCEQIVTFFGACFLPTKMCLVTEFAKFGSLSYLISKKKILTKYLRVKLCLDAAMGILYLHENGILHRDIKPDNILVFSLDTQEKVNAKLTDFGSARNINRLMTNMTFTKGIGTPVYMAPEVLDRKRYRTTADVYSFGIAMYEIIGWKAAFSMKDPQFNFPWKIAEYVMAGKRPKITKNIHEEEFSIIDGAWKMQPEERLRMAEIVEKIKKRLLKIKKE
ncbi:protein serine/threonine kinase, putative [Entamoeba invadens IP1]|uniref:Protein serine/threonine kinase, putative n=1 Tax=Entamoeba invadens IP1 TaxID=370355 RepID=A0A0A1UE40_ENTIV|nr:protein serine/threonine kinase, putative [Entamoeba invadens IP1]ELP92031.1 protein serine/threonine kinase, putative [Entamoeba invadens IP1]|eukprot:XP_004258802.1 protein serine/threonine kinase, putative [Entamoeba invadens IP1]